MRKIGRARDAGQWELAVRYYREALDLDLGDAETWAQWGHALKQAGKPPEAEFAYQRSRVLNARPAVGSDLASQSANAASAPRADPNMAGASVPGQVDLG